MQAQVSLEYLLISVVAMALLTISAATLSQIREYAEGGIGLLEFKASASALGDAIYSVCVLGSGNRRAVNLKAPLETRWNDGVLQLSGQSSMAMAVPCDVSEKRINGPVIVKNENGKVKIREQ